MRGALDVHQTLLGAGVPHEIVRLRGRVLTADDLPRVLGVERGSVAARCYTVAARSDGADAGPTFAVVLVPAGTTVSPAALEAALGGRSAQVAGPEQINARTDYAAGLVSPVCLPADVEVLADAVLPHEDVLYCAVGEGGVALAIHSSDLLRMSGARVAALTVVRDTDRTKVPATWRARLAKVRPTG